MAGYREDVAIFAISMNFATDRNKLLRKTFMTNIKCSRASLGLI